MDKQNLIQEIKTAAASGAISKQELLAAYDSALGSGQKSAEKSGQRLTFFEAIQYLGSGIVFIGIALLVGNNWNSLNTAARILITLGSAVVAFIISLPLLRNENTKKLGYAFVLISILLMPIGVYSIFNALNIPLNTSWQQIGFELCLLAIYISAFYAVRLKIYIVPITFFATTLFFSITGAITGPLNSDSALTFNEYRFLITGLSYLGFGYFFTLKSDRLFASLFYIFGIVAVLGSAMTLGGFNMDKNLGQGIWEFGYPLLVFAAMYFSIFVRQTKILVISALFLMGYVLKISSEYFSGSLGWPLAVVIAGLLMIAVGYLSVYVNRKYIQHA